MGYHRCVDDIFSAFNLHKEAKQFFSYLNSRHPNVKLTMETEVNKVFAILNVLLIVLTKFWIQLLIINQFTLVYYLILGVLLLVFTK